MDSNTFGHAEGIGNLKPARAGSAKVGRTSWFWPLNTAGWFGISLVTYFSLSLPYDQFEISYLAHNISQSLVVLR